MASTIETTAINLVRQVEERTSLKLFIKALDDLCTAVIENKKFPVLNDKIRQACKAKWEDEGELEIDDDAIVSVSERGAYVSVWIWVDAIEFK